MAGTMPHAVFIEINADGSGGVAAYAAELPGCAVFATTDEEAAGAMPRRAEAFCAWLREAGEDAPENLGENWYEVERASATESDDGLERAAFSLDELPPGDEEYAGWLRWLELAREELASAIDGAGEAAHPELLGRIAAQDLGLARSLGAAAGAVEGGPVERLYTARDLLTDALESAGPAAEGARRAVRLAIADDLRAAELLRASTG